jgi:hypothetical protein
MSLFEYPESVTLSSLAALVGKSASDEIVYNERYE